MLNPANSEAVFSGTQCCYSWTGHRELTSLVLTSSSRTRSSCSLWRWIRHCVFWQTCSWRRTPVSLSHQSTKAHQTATDTRSIKHQRLSPCQL